NSWKLVPQSTDSVLDRLESHKQDLRASPSDTVLFDKTNLQSRPAPVQQDKNGKSFRSVPLSTQPDIRRTALISNGITAHSQRVRSPSEPSIASTAANAPPPPFPVPTRMSSRKIAASSSEGARSPTPQSTAFFDNAQDRDIRRPPPKKPALRKVRSAAATIRSSHDDRQRSRQRSRSRSPPLAYPSSSDAESSELPPLPKNNLISRYSKAAQPLHSRRQQPQNPTPLPTHDSSTASAKAVQQTSVVDAIAITMIGEWMWKYARRRKSFGIPESPHVEFESGKNVSDNGARHKRWVWLAPYDRAVMWSTKQPTSGSALLGKNGRKRRCDPSYFGIMSANSHIVTIQSVLDVRDDTPMPKNSTPNVLFGRSILILTPERALKFTATTCERHYVWLTALSFLSQSNTNTNELPILPPVSTQEHRLPSDGRSITSSRKIPIRDSIRVAKGKARPRLSHAYTTPGIISQTLATVPPITNFDQLDEEEDAAEPPHVPRTLAHTRKRSITGPRAVPHIPGSFRIQSSNTMPSKDSAKNSELEASGDSFLIHSQRSSVSKNTVSENGAPVSGDGGSPNFFDAVGTIRMEAFVDRTVKYLGREHRNRSGLASELLAAQQGLGDVYRPYAAEEGKKPGRNSYRTRQGRKKDLSYWGANGSGGGGPGASTSENVAVWGGGGSGDGARGDVFAGFSS
ncbi:MAG: hypothetical protein Q9187_006874, partial [Circinaria calcarea]